MKLISRNISQVIQKFRNLHTVVWWLQKFPPFENFSWKWLINLYAKKLWGEIIKLPNCTLRTKDLPLIWRNFWLFAKRIYFLPWLLSLIAWFHEIFWQTSVPIGMVIRVLTPNIASLTISNKNPLFLREKILWLNTGINTGIEVSIPQTGIGKKSVFWIP